jgi:3-oxoacyl-[acyl-carrier protein] reductase
MSARPVALITGASRPQGIAAACAKRLARDGWDVALTYWTPYDGELGREGDQGADPDAVARAVEQHGASVVTIEADLAQAQTADAVFTQIESQLGSATALVLSHCCDLPGNIVSTPVEQFDRHFAVNVRASWLLIRELARRLPSDADGGRIVAITSDALDTSVAYGASKGALERLVVAAAAEFGSKRITANAINPGATDTGWIDDELRPVFAGAVPLGRIGTPDDCARLVGFLCSPDGGWVNGQVIHSNGGTGSR